jgi:hypothetical protein
MCNSKKLEEQRQAKLFGWETCPENDYERMVGKSYLGITSGSPVARPK